MSDSKRLERLIESNAQAIAALTEFNRQGFANILQALNEENQLISELREQTQDHGAIIANLTGAVSENSQQIEVLISESRDSRARLTQNAEEHADFRQELRAITESIQSLLASFTQEIRAI